MNHWPAVVTVIANQGAKTKVHGRPAPMTPDQQVAFFWRDIQTLRGAIRAAISRPRLDIGELRAVEANQAFTASQDEPKDAGYTVPHRVSLQSRQARDWQTKQALAHPPSLRDLFAGAMQRQMRVVV